MQAASSGSLALGTWLRREGRAEPTQVLHRASASNVGTLVKVKGSSLAAVEEAEIQN
jgi:hypothetical protein